MRLKASRIRWTFSNFYPFEHNAVIEKALTQEEFYIAQMVRDLKNLGDIHAILNEEKHIETIAKIVNIFLNKTKEQKSDS